MTQLTQGRIGHLEFGTPGTDIIVTAQKAIEVLAAKHVGVTPAIMVVNGQHESRRAEFEALGITQIIFGSTQPHMCWVGAEKVKSPARSSGRTAVRVVENVRARVLAAVDLPSVAAVETVIALPLPVVIETPISTALCRAMVGIPALPAPKIAGLLLDVNPRGPEAADRDDGQGEAVGQFAAMVLDLSMPRVIAPARTRQERIQAMLDRQIADAIPNPPIALYASSAAMVKDRDRRANVVIGDAAADLCQLYGTASGDLRFTERGFRLLIKSGPANLAAMQAAERFETTEYKKSELADTPVETEIGPMYGPETEAEFHARLRAELREAEKLGPLYGPELPPPSVLAQHLQDASDVRAAMRELAAQKSQPAALRIAPNTVHPLSREARRQRQQAAPRIVPANTLNTAGPDIQIARSSEELLEEAARDRDEVQVDKVRDFLEALEFAVNHRDNEQAQLLTDGHRFTKHGKQGHIKVKHPSLEKVEPMLVAVRLHRGDGYRFVARTHEVRAYLEKCAQGFEAKGITPIRAGELYPGEVKAA